MSDPEYIPSAFGMTRAVAIEFITAMYPQVAENPEEGFAMLEYELAEEVYFAREMVEYLLPLAEKRIEGEPPGEFVFVDMEPDSVIGWLAAHPLSNMRAPEIPITDVAEVTRWMLWVLVFMAMARKDAEDALTHWGFLLRAADTDPERLDSLASILLLFGWNIAHGHIPLKVIEDLRAMGPKRSDSGEETDQLLH